MKKAFSLLELIISLAIISILVVILSSFFKVNFNILSSSITREAEYKEACTAMLYVDTNIRRSKKIETRDNEVCNFYFYKTNMDGIDSKCYFYRDNKFLKINRDNLSTDASGRDNNIAKIKEIKLVLDEDSKLIRVYIRSLRGNFNFETAIDVGDKLWKKPLLVYMCL